MLVDCFLFLAVVFGVILAWLGLRLRGAVVRRDGSGNWPAHRVTLVHWHYGSHMLAFRPFLAIWKFTFLGLLSDSYLSNTYLDATKHCVRHSNLRTQLTSLHVIIVNSTLLLRQSRLLSHSWGPTYIASNTVNQVPQAEVVRLCLLLVPLDLSLNGVYLLLQFLNQVPVLTLSLFKDLIRSCCLLVIVMKLEF